MYYSRLRVTCHPDYTEILMAEVGDAGFETFLENDNGFEAYVEMEKFDRDRLKFIKEKYKDATPVTFETNRIEKQNWNEEWEKNYQPILVDDACLIRASFHPPQSFPYEIIITPKMSFGTGHHQTTYLMIRNQLKLDHNGKRVIDAGCGTAILSIMASKLGAKEVQAFDIDEWSIENGNENIGVNGAVNIQIQKGTISEVELHGNFDIVLANINKNVLLSELKIYQSYLNTGGLILLSGFYKSDVVDLVNEASRHGLIELVRDERENWAALVLQKN